MEPCEGNPPLGGTPKLRDGEAKVRGTGGEAKVRGAEGEAKPRGPAVLGASDLGLQ